MNVPQYLRMAGDYIRTSMNDPLTDSGLEFSVYDTKRMGDEGGLLELDYDIPHLREVVYYVSKSGNTLTIADDGRGLYGTNTVAHAKGARVRDFFVADHINQYMDRSQGGWTPIINIWTYFSSTEVTVPSGAASIYCVGDKVSLVQDSVQKYFYIIKVENTKLTLTGGSDYTLSEDPIEQVEIAKGNAVGFPTTFLIPCTLESGFSGTASLVYRGENNRLFLDFDITGAISGGTHTNILSFPSIFVPTSTVYTAGTAGTGGWFQIMVGASGHANYARIWHPTGMSSPRGQINWNI